MFESTVFRARPKAERIEGGARGAPPTFAIGNEFEFFDKRSQNRKSQKSPKVGSARGRARRALQGPDLILAQVAG